MTYVSNALNSTQTVTFKASAKIADPRGKGVKITSGKVALAGAGEDILGIALITNDEVVEAGQDVDIQIKDIGLVLAGDTFAAGDQLAMDGNGKAVKATTGNYVFGIALEDGKADSFVRFMMARIGTIQ